MAELHVQPKRKSYWWLWLIILLIIIAAAVYWYMNYYNKNDNVVTDKVATVTNVDSANNEVQKNSMDDTTAFWDRVDFNSPDTTYPEISDKNVSAKSTDRYAIYSMNDHVLFANNKSELSTEGKAGLRKIGASIYQRFKDADVRIYSQPDSLSQANLQLANQRAEAVKNFLLTNSKLNENHLSIFPNRDSTSNASVSENQRNNGIAIVAKR